MQRAGEKSLPSLCGQPRKGFPMRPKMPNEKAKGGVPLSLMDTMCPAGRENGCPAAQIVDEALVLLLSREESVLGSIVDKCHELIQIAEHEAQEVAQYLDQEL